MTDYEKLKAFAEELSPDNNYYKGYKYMYNTKSVTHIEYDDTWFVHNELGAVNYNKDGSLHLGEELIENNLDEWINETREYWREQGLPSLQKKYKPRVWVDTKSIDKLYKEIVLPEIIKEIKPKSIMKNIKDTLKALTHSKEDKALIKAGLKNEDNEWSCEARDFAYELLLEERMAQPEFLEKMLKVAEERNKECK